MVAAARMHPKKRGIQRVHLAFTAGLATMGVALLPAASAESSAMKQSCPCARMRPAASGSLCGGAPFDLAFGRASNDPLRAPNGRCSYLREGQRVEFEVKQGTKGPQASAIKPV